MSFRALLAGIFLCAALASAQSDPAQEFAQSIRPALVDNCAACHKAENVKGPAPFLRASSVNEMESDRGLWRDVSTQLRNRTMPPSASKLTEEQRVHISSWIDNRLRQTACNAGSHAGSAVTRRLNRREYRNTIRDLLGIDFEVAGLLPADGTGGAGFDTNGETLFVPPMLTERYLEATQQILDRAIVTPAIFRSVTAAEGQAVSLSVPAYVESPYDVLAVFDNGNNDIKLTLEVDGAAAGNLTVQKRRIIAGEPVAGPLNARLQINLARGSHTVSVSSGDAPVTLLKLSVQQKQDPPLPEKRASHYRIFGMEPGEQPLQARQAARQILETLLPKAFRRPVQGQELDRFLVLYDRAAERGDPYEERVKLMLKAVLVWPEFLFRVEQKHTEPGIHPLGQYELATRLSYFLWSTAPDEPLLRLAEQGRLQDAKVLASQVERMLDDSRSRSFVNSFIGQWLGTQDIGGRVVPLLTELQSYYTPDVAADLRAQPILLLDRILGEDRSLLELLNADYTHLTQRLAKFYQVEQLFPDLTDSEFRLVQWPGNKRAGILGLGGILAMSSRYKETSPVLRGAWVLDTLLGTPVPPPPPDVPELQAEAENGVKLSMREQVLKHRENPSCSACHKLMDPIGFGLENFDWMGRWRDKQPDGKPIDSSGELPSGQKFDGPVELRDALLARKGEFIGNFAGKVLGYALGRSLQDGDDCTVQRITQSLEKDGYKARTLIREIVLSIPFRNTQGGAAHAAPVISQRKLDVSALNAKKQDAASHNNRVQAAKPPAKP